MSALQDWTRRLTAVRETPKVERKPRVVFDDADTDNYAPEGAANAAAQAITHSAVATLNQWVETDDLDDDLGESHADRLQAMLIGLADENLDGELGDDEYEIIDAALAAAWDYLSSKGIADEDISALLNDWDVDAGDRVRDALAVNLPEGEDAEQEEIENYVYGSDESSLFDDAKGGKKIRFDAAYKKVFAVRDGKKVSMKKRVGHVVLSQAQRVAIKKASKKAHSGSAQARRLRSFKMRSRVGVK